MFAIDAIAIGLNFTPLKLDGAGRADLQGSPMEVSPIVKGSNQLLRDSAKAPTPILGNSLLKDAANAGRNAGNVAALDWSRKDAGPAASAAAAAAAAREAAARATQERIVYFDFDSFIVRPEAMPTIEAHARRLREDATLRVALEGHDANESRSREFSVALAQRRAESIRNIFSILGVSDSQIEVVSFGREKPAVPGTSEAAKQENRRVEINYR